MDILTLILILSFSTVSLQYDLHMTTHSLRVSILMNDEMSWCKTTWKRTCNESHELCQTTGAHETSLMGTMDATMMGPYKLGCLTTKCGSLQCNLYQNGITISQICWSEIIIKMMGKHCYWQMEEWKWEHSTLSVGGHPKYAVTILHNTYMFLKK